MKKSVVRRWVKALRSGKYTQAVGSLHKTYGRDGAHKRGFRNGHCCLGVLSEVVANDKAVKETGVPYNKETGCWGYNGPDGYLPGDVAKALGVDGQALYGKRNQHFQHFLSSRNDRQKGYWSFRKIADWLEKKFL